MMWIILIIIAVILGGIMTIYNSLITKRTGLKMHGLRLMFN